MLDWIKKPRGGSDHPMRNPTSAAAVLAELRGADAVAALNDLSGWLESLEEATGSHDKVRCEVLALIQEAGEPHVCAGLAQYLGNPAEKQVLRESKWKALFDYATALSETLCASAERLAAAAREDAHAQDAAAAAAVRGLHACRTLAKTCLVRYQSIPPTLWGRAYSLHAAAEAAGCAATPVRPHLGEKPATTATEELLRLLMLQVSMPDMMSPEQIEVAERITLQLGSDFTLRPAGAADAHFCFDPAADRPPRRASPQSQGAGARYFGPGAALEALARLYKQLASSDLSAVKAFGKDVSALAQVAAVEHLLRFWVPNPTYSRPSQLPVTDQLNVVHRYEQIWRHLPDVASTTQRKTTLAMAEEDKVVLEPPEAWELKGAGGNELGAEIPHLSGGWAKCGELVGVRLRSKDAWWLGVVRRMQAQPGGGLRADVAIFSRTPLALKLRVLGKDVPVPADWETSSDAFTYRQLDAILLADVSEKAPKPTMVLPAEGWKAGEVYEAPAWEPSRYLRVLRVLKRADGYARVEFEWMPPLER
jgi:hypothetical protein